MKRYLHYFYYLAYKFFTFVFLSVPKPVTKKILILLSVAAYHLGFERRKISKANLDLVYGDSKTDKEKNQIIKNSYKSLLFNMYEFIENQHISNEELSKKVKVENEHFVLDALKQKRKIIFITAHYGGWEIGVPYTSINYKPMVAVGKKIRNPFIQEMYKHSREKHNIKMFEKNKSAKELVKGLKDDYALAIMVDQNIGNGTEMDFLGNKALFIDSASRLALKFDALIIAGFGIMNDFRDYTVRFYKPIDVLKLKDKSVENVTKLQKEIVESLIKENPNQWLWQHKRWKKFHREIYG